MSLRNILPLLLFSVVQFPVICAADEHPDRVAQPNVPTGTMTSGTYSESTIYPGTTREWSVYVPAQYSADKPAALMVFMDGGGYSRANGAFRVPTVFDNLIHRGAMPVTIAVFVNPGNIPATAEGASGRSNRSFEYDSLGDRYVRFLTEEFLPAVTADLNISADPQQRALCGISSGAICAFNAAWERPEQFGKVLSHIGSYTNIRGGWALPGMVRLTQSEPKPLRVYLQEGKDDLNNLHGNWPLGNQDLAAALQFAGYTYRLVLTEGGHSGRWGGEELPAALEWLWSENPESTVIPSTESHPDWQPHPDAIAKDNIPQGTVTEMEPWESTIFPGTTRNWSIYVPAQYQADSPAALMIFQDGERMRSTSGRWRIPTVFDNLIARGDMPPTIAVFLDPGHHIDRPRQQNRSSNRSYEYDSLGDRYFRFLTEEIIPQVQQKYTLADDPSMWAIGGSSSGAICAFTVAWEHPERFGRVYSSVGSFTNLRGGNVYPSLVRKTEPKPIRIYMADTSGDIDNPFGSWPLSNQLMASALQYMGYDVRFDWAEGYAHNADYGSSRFPDAMKWLWRSEPHVPELDTSGDLGGDMTLLNLLVPGQDWELVAEDLGFADALCADAAGNLYYCDMRAPAVVRISAADGSQKTIAEQSVSGLEFGPNGLLYACQGSQQRVISLHPETGEVQVVAENVRPNDLAVTRSGNLYFTQTPTSQVMRVNLASGELSVAHEGISRPNGIALSNDGGTLAVSDYGGESTWTFRVNADGTLDAAMPSMPMRLTIDPEGEFSMRQAPPYRSASRGDGMAVDALGRYYVTSDAGVQVFDPTGRPCGVLPKVDQDQPLTTCMLAGADGNTLYIAHGKKIYRRQLSVRKHIERSR